MPRARVRARPRPPRLRIASICCRICAEALDQVFTTHHHALDAVNAAMCQQPDPAARWDRRGPCATPTHAPARRSSRRPSARPARQARYEQVWTLHRQGWPIAAIAAQVGCSCRTIERYLHLPTWPVRQHRRHYGRSILNPV